MICHSPSAMRFNLKLTFGFAMRPYGEDSGANQSKIGVGPGGAPSTTDRVARRPLKLHGYGRNALGAGIAVIRKTFSGTGCQVSTGHARPTVRGPAAQLGTTARS